MARGKKSRSIQAQRRKTKSAKVTQLRHRKGIAANKSTRAKKKCAPHEK